MKLANFAFLYSFIGFLTDWGACLPLGIPNWLWDAVKDVVTGEAFYKGRHPGITFEKICSTKVLQPAGARERITEFR